ncbi:MAG TPA: protein kinase [Gemmataceae bacterium]
MGISRPSSTSGPSGPEPATRTFGPGGGDRTWDLLTEHAARFAAAWETDPEPPAIADHLPAEAGAARRLVLAELIKADLAYRWQRGRPRRLEEYLAEFPDCFGGAPPCDLIYEEYHVRRQAGERVDPAEYDRRFPERAAEVRRLIAAEQETRSTAAAPAGRVKPFGPGDTLDEFELLGRLGSGAFGHVYLALQRSMRRLVAVKVAADHGCEPQTLAQLDHPHVVRVYDQRALPDRGLRLLYMQYIPGGTLQDVVALLAEVPPDRRSGATLLRAVDRALEKRGEHPPEESPLRARLARMSWPEAVAWVGARLAEALEYARKRGVLHRDVKPANVLLTAEGSPKLVDFNVSFNSKLDGANPAAYFGGSTGYMSPEQLEAFDPSHDRSPASLDTRSDLFALGVLLWELLTGERPFEDEFLLDMWPASLRPLVANRRQGVVPAKLALLPADCPPCLRAVLLACLEPDPDRRPSGGAEVARRLDLCLRPAVQDLMHPPPRGWRAAAARMPITCMLLAGVLPNLVTALFNLVYNSQEIVARLQGTGGVFWVVQGVVNSVAFPAGIAIVLYRAWRVRRALLSPPAGPERPGVMRQARRRCLRLGHDVAVIGLAGWLIAGVTYPVSLYLLAGPLPASAILHFLISLALCGLMAVAYSFFAMTYVCVRGFYPALLRQQLPASDETADLTRLSRATWFYLLLAAAVPMLAIAALVLIESSSRLALIGLSFGGLAGFGLVFWLCRTIQDDLEALGPAVQPSERGASPTGESAVWG